MRIKVFSYAFIVGLLAFVGTARAQIPVIDATNLSQNIVTAAQEVQAVIQLKNQLTELENTYTMFTNPTDIMSMATGLENQAVENPMPSATALAGLVGGSVTPSGVASAYYNQNHIYTATNGSPAANQLNANGQTIANIEGLASTNLSAIQSRLQNLPNLESDIQSATSINQVTAINCRIAAESQFVQSQQAQAANLQVLASEQQASQQQQQQEQFQADASSYVTQMQEAAASNGGN
jgi:hypothetical protein